MQRRGWHPEGVGGAPPTPREDSGCATATGGRDLGFASLTLLDACRSTSGVHKQPRPAAPQRRDALLAGHGHRRAARLRARRDVPGEWRGLSGRIRAEMMHRPGPPPPPSSPRGPAPSPSPPPRSAPPGSAAAAPCCAGLPGLVRPGRRAARGAMTSGCPSRTCAPWDPAPGGGCCRRASAPACRGRATRASPPPAAPGAPPGSPRGATAPRGSGSTTAPPFPRPAPPVESRISTPLAMSVGEESLSCPRRSECAHRCAGPYTRSSRWP